MPFRSDWSDELCPIRRSLDVLGDGWVLLIIRDVLHGRGRFDTLRDNLGISEAVLSRRLRAMVEAGLLERVDYDDGGRTRQGYAATEAAAELLPVLQQLAIWGERHTPTPSGGGHMALIHEDCGRETTRGETCSHCGEALVPEQMSWDKPWHGRRDRLVAAGELGSRPAARRATSSVSLS
ncbi:winged helix-turn-helix transcriptional regulator [Janibacter sp. RAF20_2_2]|uniref:winged helix-turn-helix transcriptional regulator n=1 Tax=unclassified Janibacter TaxID=2649294 RepID=UPI003F908097